MTRFQDRHHAGKLLAAQLQARHYHPVPIVLALPRGGVPVAYEIATTLHAPLDIFLVRKLGVPAQPELAMGAVASTGLIIRNDEVIESLGISDAALQYVAERELAELGRREEFYQAVRPTPSAVAIANHTVIVVDDGLATGSSMRAAAMALKQQRPGRLVIAVPVAPESTCRELAHLADELICLCTPELFYAVGSWYEDFSQTTDDEVKDLLLQAQLAPSH